MDTVASAPLSYADGGEGGDMGTAASAGCWRLLRTPSVVELSEGEPGDREQAPGARLECASGPDGRHPWLLAAGPSPNVEPCGATRGAVRMRVCTALARWSALMFRRTL